MYSQELTIAMKATQQAARICQRVQSTVSTRTLEKKDKSPVTVADFASQAIIAYALQTAFPHIPLIAEEDSSSLQTQENAACLQQVVEELRRELNQPTLSEETVCQWIDHGASDSYSELFWTLDPIDGTKGFLRGQQYAIALALVENGEPVCATLGCPNLQGPHTSKGVILSANAGDCQATALGEDTRSKVSVSTTTDFKQSRFCESVESAHSDHSQSQAIAQKLGLEGKSVRMDSQAKYASVARGDAEIYLRLPTRPGYVERIWDHAAGVAILKAAGGTITDIEGKALDFRHGRGLEKNRGVVASNGFGHQKIIDAIAATSKTLNS